MIRIYPIQTGVISIRTSTLQPKSSGSTSGKDSREWTVEYPILAFAIEHSSGVFIVDTGATARNCDKDFYPWYHPQRLRKSVRMRVAPEDEIGHQLQALGIGPRDIRKVILTHLHHDNAGGLHHFAHSEILVSAKNYQDAVKMGSSLRGYMSDRWPAWFSPTCFTLERRPIGPFQETLTLTADQDIIIVGTPGHVPGHVSVVIRDGEQFTVLGGDVTFTYNELMQGKAIASQDEKEHLDTVVRMKRFVQEQNALYIPTHDPESITRLTGKRQANSSLEMFPDLDMVLG